MPGRRDFSTVPVRIFDDPRPSALDFRVLACVSLHDGMSLKKGTGRGCYATFATLTAEIGCDASNLSKSLKRLVEWGYLSEERQDDRRRKTYRVIFDARETWRNDQQSPWPEVGETTNNLVGEMDNEPAEIVGDGDSRNGRNPPQTQQHYSSLKGLDSSEEEKLDSAEAARFPARDGIISVNHSLGVEANLAVLNRALKNETPVDAVGWYSLLGVLIEGGPVDNIHNQAFRLSEMLAEAMTGEEIELARANARKALNGAGEAMADPAANVVPFPKSAEN